MGGGSASKRERPIHVPKNLNLIEFVRFTIEPLVQFEETGDVVVAKAIFSDKAFADAIRLERAQHPKLQ